MLRKRFFAIRLNQGWVELRCSPKPIKGIKSTVYREAEVRRLVRIPDGYGYYIHREVTEMKKVPLTQVNWAGGRHVGVYPAARVGRYMPLPRVDHATEVKAEQVENLLKKAKT
jgi:hypothetical protein